jgi:hypothetical protein
MNSTSHLALLGLFLMSIFMGCDGCMPQQLNNWEKLALQPAGNTSIHGMAADDTGILLAFGHTDENIDCGLLGLGKCRMFKIFRSIDKGKNWSDVTNVELGKRHSFLKGDKISFWGNRTRNQLLRAGKHLFDKIMYTDYQSKGNYYSNGRDFFIYIDNTLYVSWDQGASWHEMYITDNFILPDYDHSTIEFIGDYLAIHSIQEKQKILFKRYGITFIRQNAPDFAIVYKNSKKELLFDNGNNLASDYSFTEKNVARRMPVNRSEWGNDALAEFFDIKNGWFVANATTADSFPRHFAIVSKDKGKSFKIDNIPKDVAVDCMHGLDVMGVYQDKLLTVRVCEETNIGAEKITQKRWLVESSSVFLWDVKKKKAIHIWTPRDGETSFYKFCITKDFLYCYTQNGIYRKNKFK